MIFLGIDKHLTSLSTQSEASRVQNVVQYHKDSRPGLVHNSASMFSRQDSESIGSSSRQDFKTIESSSRQHHPSDSNSGHSQTQRRREGRNNNNNNNHNRGRNNCSLDVQEDETFLWRIDTQPPSYFFGTIHVPYTRVWDAVSDNAKKAFKDSDQVYFELDLTNPYTIASLTSCQLLPRGLNLSQVLPPGLYSRLRSHLDWVRQEMSAWITEDQAGRGLYADYLYNAITGNWERKRPVWAMLMVNGLTASDIASR